MLCAKKQDLQLWVVKWHSMNLQKVLSKHIDRKVPEIIFLFWVIKLLSTALGESVSDYLVHAINPIYAVCIGAVGFGVSIDLQLFAKKYTAWIYWLAVVMVAVFGTIAADVVHIVLGVPYLISATCFAVGLVIIFVAWYAVEKDLSIHSINTPRRELFYWATVIATFALGTATGDMTAITFNLGYLASGILFTVLFIAPLVGHRLFKLNEIFTFWFAYIMTRPFGASFADWTGRAPNMGGIGIGTGKVSLILFALIIILVGYLTISKKDIKTR